MASWVNLLISLVSTPITTALFLPEELGKINLFISYANIIIPFVYLGFDQAYVRFYNEPCGKNTKKSLFKLCLLITSLLSILVAFFVLWLWKIFSNNIVGYSSIIIAFCLVLYLDATMLLRFVNLKARMENKVVLFCLQSVISTIIIKLSFVSVAIIYPNSEYAIIFRTGLLLFAGIVFCVFSLRHCKVDAVDKSKLVIFELSKFALPLFPTVFLVMLNISLSQIVLKEFVDYSVIGIYSNAVTIASIITIVQSGLNIFWTPFVYEYYHDHAKIQKMHHIVSFSLIGMAFGIIAFQDLIYLILVDKQYWGSKAIMALLLISPVCETISETLGLGIELSKKTYLKLPVYFVNITVNVLSCIILVPRLGIFGAAISNAMASFSMLLVKSIIGERFYRCSNNYSRLTISMIMLLVIAFISYYWNSGIIKIVASAICLILICFIYSEEIKLLIRNTKGIVLNTQKKKAD